MWSTARHFLRGNKQWHNDYPGLIWVSWRTNDESMQWRYKIFSLHNDTSNSLAHIKTCSFFLHTVRRSTQEITCCNAAWFEVSPSPLLPSSYLVKCGKGTFTSRSVSLQPTHHSASYCTCSWLGRDIKTNCVHTHVAKQRKNNCYYYLTSCCVCLLCNYLNLHWAVSVIGLWAVTFASI